MKIPVNLLFIFFVLFQANGQNSIFDSNNFPQSFDSLEDSIWDNYSEKGRTIHFAKKYLVKAKFENDSLRIAKGFDFLARLYNPSENLKYADSIIIYSENQPNEDYPGIGYSLKGYWNYQLGNYRIAADNYVVSYQLAKRYNNLKHIIETGSAIASLKNMWGKHKEALELFKELLHLIQQQPNYEYDFKDHYLTTLYNLNISYKKSNQFDSSAVYIDKGIEESLKLKDTLMYYDFIFSSGINLFFRNQYKEARIKLKEAKPYLKGSNLAIYYYYQGMILKEQGISSEAKEAFIKSDSMYEETQDLFPELTVVYTNLIAFSKLDNDLDNQLKYSDKLLLVDSLLDNNRNALNLRIIEGYDIPKLKEEKKELEKSLRKKTENSNLILIIGILLTGGLVVLTLNFYIKKQRFQNALKMVSKKAHTEKPTSPKPLISHQFSSEIPKEISENILMKLNEFEKNNGFLDMDIKLGVLAKEFETNSSYLSKIINLEKAKNFSSYIKDLRVGHSIELLKQDAKLRNYTIEAIAKEVGFKNSESFSKAFRAKTGIYPSYFIKEINKKNS